MSKSTCNEVETLIRNSPNSITIVVTRTPQSTPVSALLPKSQSPSRTNSSPLLKLPTPSQPPTPPPGITRTTSLPKNNPAPVGFAPKNNPIPSSTTPASRDSKKYSLLDDPNEPSIRMSDEDFDNLSVMDLPEDAAQDKYVGFFPILSTCLSLSLSIYPCLFINFPTSFSVSPFLYLII